MTSDFGSKVSQELEAASLLRTRYFITQRPWLDLYGVRLRPVSTSSEPYVDPALIHRSLPDELLLEVFARMAPYTLGRAACVCRKWRYTIRNPVIWRNACLKAWQLTGVVENYKILQSRYEYSWRKMWLLRPRVRTDGLYVSRNTYIRVGIAEWRVTNPVYLLRNETKDWPKVQKKWEHININHVVASMIGSQDSALALAIRSVKWNEEKISIYHFLLQNSSQKVKDVAKCMNFRASKADCVFRGHYTLSDDKIEAAILYPGMRPTVLRIRLRLRGTTSGANNRMDLLSLITSGVDADEINGHDEDILEVVEGWEEDETHNPDVPATSHKRGMQPFVFIPFEEVETSDLNLPVDKMDYYVPG